MTLLKWSEYPMTITDYINKLGKRYILEPYERRKRRIYDSVEIEIAQLPTEKLEDLVEVLEPKVRRRFKVLNASAYSILLFMVPAMFSTYVAATPGINQQLAKILLNYVSLPLLGLSVGALSSLIYQFTGERGLKQVYSYDIAMKKLNREPHLH